MNTAMTKADRENLQKICRLHAKVAKADASSRSAQLKAEVEAQLAAEYSYDDDQVWKQAHAAAKKAADEAQQIIIRRCQELGIPARFAPELGLHWYRRGENASKERRAELRKVAYSKIDELEKQAKLEIDRSSTDTQTKLLAAGLESSEAQAFLAAMPTAAELMPSVGLAEVRKQLLLAVEDEDDDKPEVYES